MGRAFRIMIQLLAGLAAALVIVLAVLAWRLSEGPVSLAFLTPYIERALEGEQGRFRIRLDDTILAWAGWERTLDIRVLNVRAIGPDLATIASVPEMSLSFSVQALMQGRLAPKRIELFRPTLNLIRREDGSFGVGGDGDLFQRMLANLSASPEASEALSYLTRLSIIDGDLSVDDRRLGMTWRAPNARVDLERADSGIDGEASLELLVGGERARVVVFGGYRTATRRLNLGVTFGDISPAVFSRLSPALKSLGVLDLPLRGTMSVAMTLGGAVDVAGFDLTGGGGRLVLPSPLEQNLPVEEFRLRGRYEGASDSLEIDHLFLGLGPGGTLYLPAPTDHRLPLRSLSARGRYGLGSGRLEVTALEADLGGPSLSVSATIEGIGGAMTLDAEGTLKDLAVDDLKRYWPQAWGEDARTWIVSHLSAGRVSEARARIRLGLDGAGGVRVETIKGEMDLEDFTVDYLPPMPKVVRVSGQATFDKTRFDIFVLSGETFGLRVREGSIFFTGLDQYDQVVNIQLLIDGPVRDALKLIDNEPLGFSSVLGIDPAKTSGRALTRLKLGFIVEHALTRDRVEVSATSEMTEVALADVLLGQSVSEGSLALSVDKTGMDVSGTIMLGTIPATLEWRRNFLDQAPFRGRYQLGARIDGLQDLADFGIGMGLDSGDFIRGAMDARVVLTVDDGDTGILNASLDLTDAELDIPALAWSKKAGTAATARVDVKLRGDRVEEITRFDLVADGLLIQGSARNTPDGLERIDLDRVVHGRTDMRGVLIPGRDGGWTASFHGASFDLEPLFEDLFGDSGKGSGEEETQRYSLSVDLNKVWLGPGRSVGGVAGTLTRTAGHWRTMALEGRTGKDKKFTLRIKPGKGGNRRLTILAEDAGSFLKELGFYDNMIGGTLQVTGDFEDAAPGKPLRGRLVIKDYRVLKAPVLIKLVSIMALTGIFEALEGDGLAFIELNAPFTLEDGVLKVTDTKATGLSLGYTASGSIDTRADTVDLNGTIVPAYAINSMLGKIPILGEIFTGGEEGGGVFAASYSMTGPMDDPKVSVNPLTVLAPGFLRTLFEALFKGATGPPSEQEEPKEGQ